MAGIEPILNPPLQDNNVLTVGVQLFTSKSFALIGAVYGSSTGAPIIHVFNYKPALKLIQRIKVHDRLNTLINVMVNVDLQESGFLALNVIPTTAGVSRYELYFKIDESTK